MFLSISDLNNNVNLRLDSGWTPLMHACFHGQDKIVDFLLDKGADPNLHAGNKLLFFKANISEVCNYCIFLPINQLFIFEYQV